MASALFAASTGAIPKTSGSTPWTPRETTRASGARADRLGRRLGAEQEHRGAVVQRRGVAGGDRAALDEGGLQLAELLQGGVGADPLVALELDAGDGDDLGEAALVPGGVGEGVAAEGEFVLGLARDLVDVASFSADSPRLIVHSPGIRGLTMRQPSVVDQSCSWPAGKARSGFSITQGARLIDSTPPATITSASPVSIARAAWIPASSEEPQRRLTVAPGTEVGSPASSTAMRATSRLSSPAPLALPSRTSSISGRVELGRAVEQRPQSVRGEVVGPGLRQRAAVAAEGGADRSIYVGGTHRPVTIRARAIAFAVNHDSRG